MMITTYILHLKIDFLHEMKSNFNMHFISILSILFIIINVLYTNGKDFGYSNQEQKNWSRLFYNCGGHNQSPILVNSSAAISLGMPGLEMVGYHNILPEKLILTNNGHSVSLSIEHDKNDKLIETHIPYIFGGMLDSLYEFEGLHFHWGERNNRGSEHILNDIRYPLEMHLIHRNRKYANIEEALKHNDGLTVLAVLFELRENRFKPLDAIIKNFIFVQNYGTNITLKNNFKLIKLLPFDTDTFYTYRGSLTTPPCAEVVTWIIFPEPILISFKQMNEFRILKNIKNEELGDNYRYLQTLGNRKIFVRRADRQISNHFTNMIKMKNLFWYYY